MCVVCISILNRFFKHEAKQPSRWVKIAKTCRNSRTELYLAKTAYIYNIGKLISYPLKAIALQSSSRCSRYTQTNKQACVTEGLPPSGVLHTLWRHISVESVSPFSTETRPCGFTGPPPSLLQLMGTNFALNYNHLPVMWLLYTY